MAAESKLSGVRVVQYGKWKEMAKSPLVYLVLLFFLSRWAFAAAGVRFDASPLTYYWQYVDPALLKQDLLRSLFYLHSQPPLYNLFLGLVLKGFPHSAGVVYQICYWFMGLCLCLAMYKIIVKLGVPAWAGCLVAALFFASPASILYENYLFYTYPSACLLCLAVYFFQKMTARFALSAGIAFFFVLAALVYTRSIFHLVWFLAMLGFALLVSPGQRKKVLLAAGIPFLCIFLLYLKNYAVFGSFSSSSWLGMNLAKVTTMQIPAAERKAWVENGTLTRISLVPPFGETKDYPAYIAQTKHTGIPVLDQSAKSTGSNNYNQLAYVSISKQYMDNDLKVIQLRPDVYLKAMAAAGQLYFYPSGDYPFLQENRARIHQWAEFYNHFVTGQPHFPVKPGFGFQGVRFLGVFILAGFLICIVYGMVLSVVSWRKGLTGSRAAMLFLWLNLLYVTVVGNALEIGENQRFRFIVDPLLAIMLGVIACQAGRFFNCMARQVYVKWAKDKRAGF